jgi:type II secretory pathway component GspD/PulD (secretin)
MKVLLVMALAACLQPALVGAQASRAPRGEVKVYELGLQDVATAEALVRAHLSPEGRVFADAPNHRLVVYDRPDVQARVKAALAVLDIAPRNLRIEVTSSRSETQRRDNLGASVRLGGGAPGVGVSGGSRRATSENTTRQEIVVLDGGRAEIRLAELVPEPEWFWSWGRGHGHFVEGTRWRDVGTSLLVEPRVLPDGRIRVRLTPRFEYWLDQDRRVTEIQELATDVVVSEGQEIDLGGVPLRDESFRERFLLGMDRSGRTSRHDIRLRVRIDAR